MSQTELMAAQLQPQIRAGLLRKGAILPFLVAALLKILPFLTRLILEVLVVKHREEYEQTGRSEVFRMLSETTPGEFLPESRAVCNLP